MPKGPLIETLTAILRIFYTPAARALSNYFFAAIGTGGAVWIVNPTACPAATCTSKTPLIVATPEPRSASAVTLIWQLPSVAPGTMSALKLSALTFCTLAIAGFELVQFASPSMAAGLPLLSIGWIDAVT